MSAPLAHRLPVELRADPSRVVAQPFLPGEQPHRAPSRMATLLQRVLTLDEADVELQAGRLVESFGGRHRDYPRLLARHAAIAAAHLDDPATLSPARTLVLGASLTAEYATEAAALCNPSAVEHPDQTGLGPDQLRVAVSLRAIGEGHISSIAFCSAVIGPGPSWEFTERERPAVPGTTSGSSDYLVDFPADTTLTQRILRPSAADELGGMEDARFTRFTDGDTVEYRATYTAYDGHQIAPRLLLSHDLRRFRVHRLAGPAAHNKGMALFPRLVGGRHLALCRADGENISLAASSDGYTWNEPTLIHEPHEVWEMVQVGNCGPPIETDRGWLVLTHGVGPMRTYAIGAILLDLDNPGHVIGRLTRPLLEADGDERDGYVPNVVYSCGGLIHDGRLWLPYGIDDSRIGVAWASLDDLLTELTATG